nr:hypothetical protein CFP56_09751 [Quercus suber]
MAHQTNDLVKENANFKSEVATLYEHIEKVKEEAIEEYQIKLTVLTTLATKPTPNDVETDEEVLVTEELGGVAEDPMDPQEQTDNPSANP